MTLLLLDILASVTSTKLGLVTDFRYPISAHLIKGIMFIGFIL